MTMSIGSSVEMLALSAAYLSTCAARRARAHDRVPIYEALTLPYKP